MERYVLFCYDRDKVSELINYLKSKYHVYPDKHYIQIIGGRSVYVLEFSEHDYDIIRKYLKADRYLQQLLKYFSESITEIPTVYTPRRIVSVWNVITIDFEVGKEYYVDLVEKPGVKIVAPFDIILLFKFYAKENYTPNDSDRIKIYFDPVDIIFHDEQGNRKSFNKILTETCQLPVNYRFSTETYWGWYFNRNAFLPVCLTINLPVYLAFYRVVNYVKDPDKYAELISYCYEMYTPIILYLRFSQAQCILGSTNEEVSCKDVLDKIDVFILFVSRKEY